MVLALQRGFAAALAAAIIVVRLIVPFCRSLRAIRKQKCGGVNARAAAIKAGTIILATSNVGTDTVMALCADPDTRPEPEDLAKAREILARKALAGKVLTGGRSLA